MCSMMAMALSYRSNPTGVKSGNFATFACHQEASEKAHWPLPVSYACRCSKLSAESRSLLAKQIDPQEHQQVLLRSSLEAKTNTFQLVAERWWNVKKTSVTEDYAEDYLAFLLKEMSFRRLVTSASQISKLIPGSGRATGSGQRSTGNRSSPVPTH